MKWSVSGFRNTKVNKKQTLPSGAQRLAREIHGYSTKCNRNQNNS